MTGRRLLIDKHGEAVIHVQGAYGRIDFCVDALFSGPWREEVAICTDLMSLSIPG